jgi:hypothetical protein
MLLAQILGGVFGISIAYIWHRLDENKRNRDEATLQARYQAELEEIKKSFS